jgi:hypothetical protein
MANIFRPTSDQVHKQVDVELAIPSDRDAGGFTPPNPPTGNDWLTILTAQRTG